MKPLLEAALSEDPRRIEQALRESGPAIQEWLEYLQRWTAHIRVDAERMKAAKAVWDLTIGAIAAYETAGALAEIVASGGPPGPPMPAMGGGAAAMELDGRTYVALAEAIRRLIASGALDAALVAALSPTGHLATSGSIPKPSPRFEPTTNPPQLRPRRFRPGGAFARCLPPSNIPMDTGSWRSRWRTGAGNPSTLRR
jgi:hypothetical protein